MFRRDVVLGRGDGIWIWIWIYPKLSASTPTINLQLRRALTTLRLNMYIQQ